MSTQALKDGEDLRRGRDELQRKHKHLAAELETSRLALDDNQR